MQVTQGYPISNFNGITVNTNYPCMTTNYTASSSRDVQYIVMHYTGNSSDTALANARYFNGNRVEASAHYFVDESSCYQSVGLNNRAWAVGGTSYYKHPNCRNANSISIEMCCSRNYTVSEITITNAAYLCAKLCNYLGISAQEVDTYVIRHFDVWDKECPAQWASTYSEGFVAFKNRVIALLNGTSISSNPYDTFLNVLVNNKVIEDKDTWSKYGEFVRKSEALAVIDKYTGGVWSSEENTNSHWAEKHVYSLCGKGVIADKSVWLNCLDAYISKADLLALVAKIVNDGGTELHGYEIKANDHWGRNYLNFLCDKAIITTPDVWCDDFEATVNRGNFMALICKAFKIN